MDLFAEGGGREPRLDALLSRNGPGESCGASPLAATQSGHAGAERTAARIRTRRRGRASRCKRGQALALGYNPRI